EERLALVRHGRQPGRNVDRPVSAGGVALRETAHTFDVSTLAHLAAIKGRPSGRLLFSPSPFNRHDRLGRVLAPARTCHCFAIEHWTSTGGSRAPASRLQARPVPHP